MIGKFERDNGRSCDYCKFWSQGHSLSGDGECRRNAPVLVPRTTKDEDGDDCLITTGFWPATVDFEWCGQFETLDARDLDLLRADYEEKQKQ